MANRKKRKRPTGTGAGTATAGRRQGAGAAAGPAPSVRVQPAEPGGPNRQARKEEARRQREALRRKQARRKYYRVIGALVAVLLAAAAITAGVLISRKSSAKILKAAGCGPVQVIKAYPNGLDRAHIGAQGANGQVPKPPPLSSYPSTPPASGPHDQTPLPTGVYNNPPNIYRTIHSLEHGAVVIWYSPKAPTSLVAELATKFAHTDHVIVAKYDYPKAGPAGQL